MTGRFPLARDHTRLLWADVRDFRAPATATVRGVRFLTSVEVLSGVVFILEGFGKVADGQNPQPRRFVTAAFEHALAECKSWQLAKPRLTVFLSKHAGANEPLVSTVVEVHGETAVGTLVVKLQSGDSVILGASTELPGGLLRRLFPPPGIAVDGH
jgi:hypothetical protein